MDRPDDLMDLCERWRQLTKAETDAITAADWAKVDSCQEAKRALQPLILAATEAPRARASQGRQTSAPLRRLVDELIALEAGNRDLILARQREAERQFSELQRSSRSLRQLHKAYAREAHTHWHSYS
jgi:hypothetical protein